MPHGTDMNDVLLDWTTKRLLVVEDTLKSKANKRPCPEWESYTVLARLLVPDTRRLCDGPQNRGVECPGGKVRTGGHVGIQAIQELTRESIRWVGWANWELLTIVYGA
jgi:hypothetical protein